MTKRERTLGFLLLLAVAGGEVAYYLSASDRAVEQWTAAGRASTPVSSARVGLPAPLSDAGATEFAGIRAAEQIEDPVARCLAYPNPPEFSWDPQVVAALCRTLGWKMITWREIDAALDQGHPDVLEQAFDTYVAANYSEPGGHGFLIWAYRWMFQGSSQTIADRAQRWVRSAPDSAYASAARGIYYVAAAYAARGTDYSQNTPPENFERMHRFIDKARVDLDQSLQRNSRMIVAYYGLMRIARLQGDQDAAEVAARKALELDPADSGIYAVWLDANEPKWGGSWEQMQAVADEADRHSDANPRLKTLRASPLCAQALEYRCAGCGHPRDDARALELYRKAAAFGPAACFLSDAPATAAALGESETAVRYYSQAYRFGGDESNRARRASELHLLKQSDWALADLDRILKRDPGNRTAWRNEGWIYSQLGRPLDAEKVYLAAHQADAKDADATLALGELYLEPLHQPDKVEPLVASLLEQDPNMLHAWTLKAALAGARNDDAMRVEALEKYLSLVDPDDPGEQQTIARAKAHVKYFREKLQK